MENKPKKTVRKNFRFTEQIAGYLSDLSERLGKTENEIVGYAIFDLYHSPEKFITCPEAGPDMWIKEEIPNTDPIMEFECENGNRFWYDFDEDKVIKVVKN